MLALRPSKGGAHKKSGCKLNLQITRMTIASAIALIVAMANAVSYSSLVVLPYYTMDSNADQSVG